MYSFPFLSLSSILHCLDCKRTNASLSIRGAYMKLVPDSLIHAHTLVLRASTCTTIPEYFVGTFNLSYLI